MRPGTVTALRSLLTSRDAGQAAFAEIIARVRAPTLILWGREDAWTPLRDADRFESAIPGSRKVVLEQCGHMPQEEKPKETTSLLREFLRPASPGDADAVDTTDR
jgi:pimeloyl-ACP methyl ester carboxylesterase